MSDDRPVIRRPGDRNPQPDPRGPNDVARESWMSSQGSRLGDKDIGLARGIFALLDRFKARRARRSR